MGANALSHRVRVRVRFRFRCDSALAPYVCYVRSKSGKKIQVGQANYY